MGLAFVGMELKNGSVLFVVGLEIVDVEVSTLWL